MKRTTLMLDAQLLERATRLGGDKTYSRTVQRALEDYVRRIEARQILALAGTGLWAGDLARMRDDKRLAAQRRRRAGRPPA
ncbi:MAG: type II toxin-antitoxin system VapB family antitoxin [Deltaproteobacteria bacterium]|nr:type II toxin-antitoxin system VapB family antitoxin [Deltaproteobacteria bacterium]